MLPEISAIQQTFFNIIYICGIVSEFFSSSNVEIIFERNNLIDLLAAYLADFLIFQL